MAEYMERREESNSRSKSATHRDRSRSLSKAAREATSPQSPSTNASTSRRSRSGSRRPSASKDKDHSPRQKVYSPPDASYDKLRSVMQVSPTEKRAAASVASPRQSSRSVASPRQSSSSPRRSVASPRQSSSSPRRSVASPHQSSLSPRRSVASPHQSGSSSRRSSAMPRQSPKISKSKAKSNSKQRPPDIETGQQSRTNPLLTMPEPVNATDDNPLVATSTWGTWGQDWYEASPGNANGKAHGNYNANVDAYACIPSPLNTPSQGPNPPRKINMYPIPSNASHLTDSGAEDNGNVYHLHRDKSSTKAERLYTGEVAAPSKRHREKLQKWYEQKKMNLAKTVTKPTTITSPIRSFVSSDDDTRFDDDSRFRSQDSHFRSGDTTCNTTEDGMNGGNNTGGLWAEDDYWKAKQGTAYLSITLTAIQLLLLMMQLAMCGVANLDVNPMIGPFPDAFSEWGGKNAYLMLLKNQWWRLITPAFLHVGVLHLFANAFCQLETVALFEREWGSLRWAIVYLLSAVGGTLYSSVFDPNTIAVGSSGALMGMYAAKLSQVMSHTFFDVNKTQENDVIRLDQLSGVLCGLTLVSLLSSFTYIDWSGHMGGLVTGLFAGMILFCRPIANCCSRFLWASVGVLGLVSTLTAVVYVLLTEIEPNQDLSDTCNYFRSLFPENYECGCLWQ